MHRATHGARAALLASAVLASLVVDAPASAATKTSKAPMTCTRGGDQTYRVTVTAPDRAATGSTYRVRIDSFPSGKIEHDGLLYLHDMEAEYLVPAGTSYVEGSAKLVAGTGTKNVSTTAKVFHDKGVVHLRLPAKIEVGGSYTPPSIEFDLAVKAPAGNDLVLKFLRYSVLAHAIVVGDVKSTCEPKPSPFPLITTTSTKK